MISIGNLTTGGTGKTPFSIWVTQQLHQLGIQPAIISRGYGASKKAVGADGQTKNDEAMEIEARLPGIVQLQDPDRVAIARTAVQEHSVQAIVLDDGFQHRRLARDLDLVLIDATCPFGFEHLLPRGLLREPVQSLARADAVVITRSELVTDQCIEEIKSRVHRHANIPVAVVETVPCGWLSNRTEDADGDPNQPLSFLATKKLYSFCAIGNPSAFQQTMKNISDQIQSPLVGHRSFPDHHLFTDVEIRELVDGANAASAEAMVCTHKDLVKLDSSSMEPLPLFALVIGIAFREGENELLELLARTVID